MKFHSPMLVVTDMEKSKWFYKEVLGLHVTLDLGVNVTLTGGIGLQTKESWAGFIHTEEDQIHFRGKDKELYFEEDRFDSFLEKLKGIEGIEYLHPVQEHDWGQRVVRFYDPDGHIIEVGENLKDVCRRFLASGMSEEETAAKMGMPMAFVRRCK